MCLPFDALRRNGLIVFRDFDDFSILHPEHPIRHFPNFLGMGHDDHRFSVLSGQGFQLNLDLLAGFILRSLC